MRRKKIRAHNYFNFVITNGRYFYSMTYLASKSSIQRVDNKRVETTRIYQTNAHENISEMGNRGDLFVRCY